MNGAKPFLHSAVLTNTDKVVGSAALLGQTHTTTLYGHKNWKHAIV